MTAQHISELILPILRKHGVRRASLFGSVVRNEATDASDVDLLVEIPDDMSLLGLAGLKVELEETLGRRVDIGEYGTIKPIIRERVMRKQTAIL